MAALLLTTVNEQVAIYDCDMDVSDSQDSVYVHVSKMGSRSGIAESEIFELVETQGSSGLAAVFTGLIYTSTNASYMGSGDGFILADIFSWNETILNITYDDIYSSSSGTVVRSALSRACFSPTILVSQTISGTVLTNSKFATNVERLKIVVYDGSQNLDSQSLDTATIHVYVSPRSPENDMENIILYETGLDTGAFTGEVCVDGFDSKVQGDLELSPLSPGDVLNFTYRSCLEYNTSVAIQCVDRGSWIMDSKTISIGHGRNLTVTVSDRDLNTNPLVSETYINIVRLIFTGMNLQDIESISVKESGISSNLFTGRISISQAVPVIGNNVLEMDCTGTSVCNLTRIYHDSDCGDLLEVTNSDRRGIVSISSKFPALEGPSYFIVGEVLDVTAIAGDARVLTSVRVIGSNNTSIILTLTEKVSNSGIFTGTLQTLKSWIAGSESSMSIAVEDGGQVQVSYIDSFIAANGSAVHLTGRHPGIFSVQPDPFNRSILQYNGTIAISLYAKDMNLNSTISDSVIVKVVVYSYSVPLNQSAPALVSPENYTTNVTNSSNSSMSSATSSECSSSFSYLSPFKSEVVLIESSSSSNSFKGGFTFDNGSSFYTILQTIQAPMAVEICFSEPGASARVTPRLQRWIASNSSNPILPSTLLGGSLLKVTIRDNDADLFWSGADSIKVFDMYLSFCYGNFDLAQTSVV